MIFEPLCISRPTRELTELPRLKLDTESIAEDFRRHFSHTLGRDQHCNSTHYPYAALALTLRDRLLERMKDTRHTHERLDCKRVHYMSLEFLMGRALGNAMLNLGMPFWAGCGENS